MWRNDHFRKTEWDSITYIVGPNGTGKTIAAEEIKNQFAKNGFKARYFSGERISNLGNKWDRNGYLHNDNLANGLNTACYNEYKARARDLGQSIDALIELRNKLDLQIRIEAVFI